MKTLRVVTVVLVALVVLSSLSFARVDKALIIGGYHDLRSTGLGGQETGVNGPSYALCNYCHVAHKFAGDAEFGGLGPQGAGILLWNHTLSSSTAYTAYASWTQQATDLVTLQPTGDKTVDLNNPSIMCMSCHDGTVALNSTYTGAIGSNGTLPTGMIINPADANKTHPVNFTYDAALAANAGMRVPAGPNGVDFNGGPNYRAPNAVVPLFNGKMQCSTCHEPHTNTHLLFRNFNAVYTGGATGSWCLYCHSDQSGSTT
jgi:hypothetical protein